MPAKSARQYRYMQLIAHGMKSKKGLGPSKEVASEFIHKTPANKRKEWSRAGQK